MSASENTHRRSAAVVGAGPAGLMAAEVLIDAGLTVDVYERKPSVGRKLLMAGKGGLNITHSEPVERFRARYGPARKSLEAWLRGFGPNALRDWVERLGISTFVGTSGRVFPHEMKAAPLLRAWLHRLRASGVRFHVRHHWLGWDERGALRFTAPEGETRVSADAVILAMGGASWPQLGSNGAWVAPLSERGVTISPLRPANCGFDVGWSPHFSARFAGEPVKSIVASYTDRDGITHRKAGELIVTTDGLEGGLIYAISASLRDAIENNGVALLTLDLAPSRDAASLTAALSCPRGSRSLAGHIQSRTGLKGVKTGLLREIVPADEFKDSARLAAAMKALTCVLRAPRPLAESISTAGGIVFEAVDERLMLHALPGVFCAGEMLDWEAPTGGYLLTACFATGRAAGLGVLSWLESPSTDATIASLSA